MLGLSSCDEILARSCSWASVVPILGWYAFWFGSRTCTSCGRVCLLWVAQPALLSGIARRMAHSLYRQSVFWVWGICYPSAFFQKNRNLSLLKAFMTRYTGMHIPSLPFTVTQIGKSAFAACLSQSDTWAPITYYSVCRFSLVRIFVGGYLLCPTIVRCFYYCLIHHSQLNESSTALTTWGDNSLCWFFSCRHDIIIYFGLSHHGLKGFL